MCCFFSLPKYEKASKFNLGVSSHQTAMEKAETEYAKYRQKTKDNLTPVERDYLESIKDVQKKLEEKPKRKKKNG